MKLLHCLSSPVHLLQKVNAQLKTQKAPAPYRLLPPLVFLTYGVHCQMSGCTTRLVWLAHWLTRVRVLLQPPLLLLPTLTTDSGCHLLPVPCESSVLNTPGTLRVNPENEMIKVISHCEYIDRRGSLHSAVL